MAYGVTLSSTLPTVGVTAGPTYATLINAAIQEIRDVLANLVSAADIRLLDNLDFEGFAPVNMGRAHFYNQGDTTDVPAASNPVALFVADGELYFNDNSSRQVQITSAGAVNVSTTGGITSAAGAYGSGGVEVIWDSGANEYRFRSGTGTDSYANLRFSSAYFNDGSGNHVRLRTAAIASDYTVTFPSGVPASTLPVLMDSAGALSTSGTLANLVSITTSGNATIGGTTTSTGLITATAGVTAAVDQHITVSGTGKFKHGTRTQFIPATAAQSSGSVAYSTANGLYTTTGATGVVQFPIVLDTGCRITDITFLVIANGTGTKTMIFYRIDTGGTVGVETDTFTTDFGGSLVTVSMALADVTTASNTVYFAHYGTVDTGDAIAGCFVTYDQP